MIFCFELGEKVLVRALLRIATDTLINHLRESFIDLNMRHVEKYFRHIVVLNLNEVCICAMYIFLPHDSKIFGCGLFLS